MATFSRPPHYPYSFKALKDVPRRIFNPPRAEIKIGRVRSMSLTPLFEVKLADVLDGQHLPPLSLKDFEEYLLFAEHSPENLYFIKWLRDYTKAYSAWAQTGTQHSAQLALSWSRAKQTFLVDGAHFKLNLSNSSLEGLVSSDASSPISPVPSSQSSKDRPLRPSYPAPPALSKIRGEVEDMLRESLNRFVCNSCGNSGRARGLFGISLGVITLLVGLAPVFVSVFQGRGGRAVRIAAIPVFWLGAWVTIMSLHGVCILIFLFGDARQLYPYELARPKITSPICKPQLVTISPPEIKTPDDPEKSGPADPSQLYVDLEKGNMGSCSSTSSIAKQSRQPSGSSVGHAHHVRGDSNEMTVMPSPQTVVSSPTSVHNLIQQPHGSSRDISLGSSGSSQPWSIDFDAFPVAAPHPGANPDQWDASLPGQQVKKIKELKGSPTFGPLTKVLSPVVTRAQWEVFVRSALMAVVVALILGAICLVIPTRK
ncbi:hypothetical protein CTheo_754 [Ceratobasidium theobromae]|uniref:Transmembrane protein n=1 Tax=Ceratobasidium theobromae TaxID=1582974 RepID=A0A5N5QVX5_9AGAM|nr:hypothetical protein CTheo_754 [Ceratobasidium theobromae]